jgi:prolyl oligopeptidase
MFAATCLLALAALAQGPAIAPPPATPKRPVTDEYQGVKVTDDYRWLENWDDPEVKQWSAAQNAYTREYLDHLPSRPAIKARLKQLIGATSARYYDLQFRGGTLFAMKNQPPKQQPMLVAMHSADDPGSEKIVFDPNAASSKGSMAIDFYVHSMASTWRRRYRRTDRKTAMGTSSKSPPAKNFLM